MELALAIDSTEVDRNLKSASQRNGFVDSNYVDSRLGNKSDINHTHTEYATVDHEHTEYASKDYVDSGLSGKSSIDHVHTDMATMTYVDSKIPEVIESTYEYTKANNIVLTETEVLIATVDLASIPEGVYELGYSFEVNFGGIKDKSVHFRMDIDGVAGTEFDTQSDKRANHKNRRYSYPKPRVAGPCKMEFYMWKQSGVSAEIVLDWCDVTIEWKKS